MSVTATPMMSNFNGGEVSRRLEGRTDTAVYAIAVQTMENFSPTIEGAAIKRSGFAYIRAAMASAAWLGRFVFNVTQAYVIEWGEQKLRFFTNGDWIETAPSTPYEVAVPYTAAEAPVVCVQQSFDRLYMAHGSHAPAALSRTGATTFVHAALALEGGPFADENSNEAVTVTASGTSGSVTITASSPIFLSGHVGAPFRIEAADFSTIKAWEPGFDGVQLGDVVRSDGKAYEAVQLSPSARTGSVQPIHSRGAEWDGIGKGEDINEKDAGGVKWQYLHDRFGVGVISSVSSATQAVMTVTRRLPDAVTSIASFRWSHGLFSAAAGWPELVLIAFGRLIFFKGFDMVASVAGGYQDFRAYTPSGVAAPDMAFRRRLALSNPPLWARADRKQILIGTVDGEYAIVPLNPGEILSGDNIDCVPQSFHGVAPVQPAQVGTATVFAQRGRRKIRASDYQFGQDRNVAPDLTAWARHIGRGVRQLAFQQNPEELLFGVRADGQMFVHPRSPEQEVKGFGRIRLAADGKVLSAVCIPSDDGDTDDLWALVERDGAKSIEKMGAWWDEDDQPAMADAFFVDSGVSYDGPPIDVISSGLAHLAGRTVRILADGAVVPDMVVTNDGGLPQPLGFKARRIHIGLGYTARIVTLRPEVRSPSGQTSQGKRKRVFSIILRLLETAGIRVMADGIHADNVIDRPGSAPMDAPVPLFTGDTDSKLISGNWGREGQVELISDDPLPCTIVAAMPAIEVSER